MSGADVMYHRLCTHNVFDVIPASVERQYVGKAFSNHTERHVWYGRLRTMGRMSAVPVVAPSQYVRI